MGRPPRDDEVLLWDSRELTEFTMRQQQYI